MHTQLAGTRPEELLMIEADSRKVVKEILAAMKRIFSDSTRGARERAWKKFCTERGKAEVRKLINNPAKPLNQFEDFLTFKEWVLVENDLLSMVPPEPGTTPLPPGHVRLFHYINIRDGDQEDAVLRNVMTNGLDISKARGHIYQEPDAVWASTQVPGNHKIFVEFFVPIGDARWGIGRPKDQKDADWLHKTGANVTFQDSIRPDEIVAVHLPWHRTYRYLVENNMVPEVLAGEYDYLLDKPDSDEARAIMHIKQNAGSSPR